MLRELENFIYLRKARRLSPTAIKTHAVQLE